MMDKFTQSIVELEFEQSAYLDQIEEGTSSVRSGFDAKAHADKLLAHPTFQTNHLSYGLKSAQKRQDKGTFDTELNKKMGKNLANIGASRVGEKYNAAEQRAVGEHIANHIAKKVGAIKEAVDAGADNAKIKAATKKDSKPFPGDKVLKGKNIDNVSKKNDGEGADDLDEEVIVEDWEDETDTSAFSRSKNDGKYKVQKFPKGRVVQGKRASGYDAGEDNEKEVQSPVGKSTVAADHPWIPKPVTPKAGTAKQVTQGVQTQRAGKTVSPERAAAVRARAARAKTPAEKAKLLKSIGESIEMLEAPDVANDIAAPRTTFRAIHKKTGAVRRGLGHLQAHALLKTGEHNIVKEEVEEMDEAFGQKSASRESAASKGIQGVKASDFFAAMKGKSKAEVSDIMAKRKDAIAKVRKEGMMYHYDIHFEEGIIHSGKAVTEAAANTQAERFINMMIETYESMPEPLEMQDILRIGKTLASNK